MGRSCLTEQPLTGGRDGSDPTLPGLSTHPSTHPPIHHPGTVHSVLRTRDVSLPAVSDGSIDR